MEPSNKEVRPAISAEWEPFSQKPKKSQYSPPPRHTAILKPASLNAKKAAQQRETKKSGGEAKEMVTHESVGSRRMTRSMTASQAASSQPQEELSAGDIQQGSSHPTENPKPATKARKEPTAVPKAKGSQTAATMAKTRTKTKPQLPVEEQASRASGPQKVAGSRSQPNNPHSGGGIEPVRLSARKPASRLQRPKAVDLYESPGVTETPEDSAGPPPSKPTPHGIVKQEPAAPAPTTPAIPWDIYGIADSSGGAQAKSKPAEAPREKESPSINKTTTKALPKTPRQNTSAGLAEETVAGFSFSEPSTDTARAEELSDDQEADPHDKSMDADYIPVGPGPMPKIPKLPKAPKKRPLSSGQPPSRRKTQSPMLPLTAPLSTRGPAPEADPAIWNVGTNAPPLHATPRGLARPGSVYCETCFRDDLARWIRIRDGVVRVLHLLGGDTALEELRILTLDVEEAELSLTEEYQASRIAGEDLGSPPPSEYASSSSEPEGEAEGPGEEAVAAKKIIVMSESGYSWEAPHFNEYPSDTVGIVLLRILAERPTSGLNRAQRDEVNGLLDSLRQDVDISPRFFQAMTTVGRNLVVRWRMKRLPKDEPGQQNTPGKAGHWWWDFDDTLQTAHEEISAKTHLPSLFVSTLATKAHDASLGALTAKEAVTAQKLAGMRHTNAPHQVPSLAEVEKALLMTTASNAFLKSIGDKLALAKHQLTHPDTEPTPTNPKQKRALSPSPSPNSPPPKRRKPNTTTATPIRVKPSQVFIFLMLFTPLSSPPSFGGIECVVPSSASVSMSGRGKAHGLIVGRGRLARRRGRGVER
ncbi:predicted protein [Chaetomium globosum CBS 148.51]|uniref:Uncharacterized protein n=1 Tax=Chaetomium globosum (strain ATCC 6205 / CBS 148.51 / DSM 1962 / NBRC 6347 / NRRL 1970) TaxID=306901 RepID=Q2HBW0_CHAGB|nr:uncharacterized protein CHGG_02294 [Chaetomium globosum CBS 148.51]EAQ90359.1 predicted protein [Chaetomium globosum CBS 148.51]